MTGIPDNSEEAALDRWLEDLEQEATLRGVVARRLEEDPVEGGDLRERVYRAAAKRWFERDRPRVALSLLERSMPGGPIESGEGPGIGRPVHGLGAQLETFAVGRPGSAGLPALTEEEFLRLRDVSEPDEAMKIIETAQKRLVAHGQEARRLLRAWRTRQDS